MNYMSEELGVRREEEEECGGAKRGKRTKGRTEEETEDGKALRCS